MPKCSLQGRISTTNNQDHHQRPHDDKHTYHGKVTNSSVRRIGWAFKTANMKRLGVDPKEAALVAVSCYTFAHGQEDTNNSCVTIEWSKQQSKADDTQPDKIIPDIKGT